MVLRVLVIVALASSLSACASMRRNEAIKTERLLTAAGFQMRLADSPEKLAQIKALPQRQIVPQSHEGRPMFVYADAADCECVYAGTQRAYTRYERILTIKGIQDERREIAESREAAAMNLGAFGPWGPWWY